GAANDVIIVVLSHDDEDAVEVVVVERGRWASVNESQSFTIDYELSHSTAPERADVTKELADTIASRDRGLPSPDAIPLRAGDPTVLPWWLEMLRGVRGMLFGASIALLALLAFQPSPGMARAGVVLGLVDLTALVGVPSLRPDVGAAWTMPACAALLILA